MGIDYTIVNWTKKEYLRCPILELRVEGYLQEWCGSKMIENLNPGHCCVRMMVYLMFDEWRSDIVSFAGDWDLCYEDDSWKDITLETMVKFEKRHSQLHPKYFPMLFEKNKVEENEI